jgi:UDP-glucuronate decarboxylase
LIDGAATTKPRHPRNSVLDYPRQLGLKIKVARAPSTLAIRECVPMMGGHNQFIVHAFKQGPIRISGDGSQTRTFCCVENTLEGLIRLMNSSDDVTGADNIGSPDKFTVPTLAETILQKVRADASIQELDLSAGNQQQRQPDIERAREFLNWQPRVSRHGGFDRTIAYFRELLGKTKRQSVPEHLRDDQ